jgi:periplasmic protein TonB
MPKKSAKKSRTRSTSVRAHRITGIPVVAPAVGRSLWIALGISLSVHALLLTLHFKFPEAPRAFQDKALDIILVNSKSARKPTEAQALAQTNLDGGGNTDQNRRVKTPLPPSAKIQDGTELEKAEKRIQALEAKQQRLLALARSKEQAPPATEQETQPEPIQVLSGRDLANSALAMARLEGEISKNTDDYNKRPRKKFIGTRAEEYRFAQYTEDWRLKVEKVGTLNYPEAAKGKLYGSLLLSVTIKSDGTVDNIEIDRSSGHKILDDAARRIVTMAGPYAAFPPDIRRDTDLVVISRVWNFTNNNQLETKSR